MARLTGHIHKYVGSLYEMAKAIISGVFSKLFAGVGDMAES